MEIEYKGFSIINSIEECDDYSGRWNGRYRIIDSKGAVAYESFTEPYSDREEAYEVAKKSAYEWINAQ